MKKQTLIPWYTEEAGFFGPNYLKEFEFNNAITQSKTIAQVDFIEEISKLKKGAKILDCPCGHGRHSIELARRGYKVTGQDINEFFLNKAREDAKTAGVSVNLVKGDMREIPFQQEFDLALNLFTSFGYLESDEEDQKHLNQMAKALKIYGKLIIDVINRDRIIREYKEKDWQYLSDGSVVVSTRKFDHGAGRNFEVRDQMRKKEDDKEPSYSIRTHLRLYTIPELISMLCKAGLIIKDMYGDYDGSAITFESKRYILVAEKNTITM